MRNKSLNAKGFTPLLLPILVAAVLVVGGTGAYVYHHSHKSKTPVVAKSTTTAKTPTQTSKGGAAAAASNPYAGWQTYTSSEEKASFKYPSNWTVDPQGEYVSNDSSNKDCSAIMSPDGKVVVRWTSELDGLGNEPGASYPLNTLVSKTPLPSISGDYVVSGITTLDGSNYYPWIALENDPTYGVLTSGVGGNLDLFMGVNNINPTTGTHDTALFSTSGPKTNDGAPALTETQAIAYLSNSDMQQAKQILQSFSY